MLLEEICKVESNNYQKTDKWKYFNYLDTGSLTKNKIDEFQYFTDVKDLPSRAKQKVNKDNILYSSVRPNQEHYGYIDKDYDNLLVSTGFIVITPDVLKVNPKYLYYFLTQQKIIDLLQNIAQNSTSAYPSITKDDILGLEIDLPDRPTQDKIVEILSNIDNQVEKNIEMTKRLQVLAQTIYSTTFEQYLGFKTIYNEELKRNIPVNWKVLELENFIKLNNGISYKEENLSSGIPMINLNSFNLDGSYKVDGIKYYNGSYKKENILKPFDLLISKTDVTRNRDIICKSILVPSFFNSDIVCSSDISKIEYNDISKYFLNALFNSKSFHNYIKSFANGTVVLHLIVNGLLKFKIPVPDDKTFEEYDKKIKPLYEQIYDIIEQNNKLNQLKSKLLPLLINGQLEI